MFVGHLVSSTTHTCLSEHVQSKRKMLAAVCTNFPCSFAQDSDTHSIQIDHLTDPKQISNPTQACLTDACLTMRTATQCKKTRQAS